MRNDFGTRPRKKLAGGKRVGKQFGGGLPIQPTVAASPMGVAASPTGVAARGRRFGMKRGGKSK